jgi:hypothetical protein
VTVTGTVVSDETSGTARSACSSLGWDTWSVDDNGTPIAGQGGTVPESSAGPQSISTRISVARGDTLDLVVAAGASASADPACAPVGITFEVDEPGVAPTPAFSQPQGGAVVDDGQPQFAGTAGAAFGDGGSVTVRVYQGTKVNAAALVETVSGDRSGSDFSLAPSPFLYDGTYTAEAEQDDAVGDRGFSAPVTFKVADPLPPITLAPVGRAALATATPTLRGTAGTLGGDSTKIDVYVWAGTVAHGYPLRHVLAPLAPDGRWRAMLSPGLRDGEYVAIASQNGPAGMIGSQPVRFEIKVHPPVVTLVSPAAGARVAVLVASGTASTSFGDFDVVTVSVYRGDSVSRRALASVMAEVRRGGWRLRWPRRLRPGIYTVRATHRDNAGHVASSSARTFTVVGRVRR